MRHLNDSVAWSLLPKLRATTEGIGRRLNVTLGTRLPEDYKRLIETFGQGGFLGEAYCSGLLLASYLGRLDQPSEPRDLRTISAQLRLCHTRCIPTILDCWGLGHREDKDTMAVEYHRLTA